MNAKLDSIERRSRDTRPLPAWRGAHPATPCKAALLAFLMAGLCPGQLRADGFFDPPPPSAERDAAIAEAVRDLEARGLPALPTGADWGRLREVARFDALPAAHDFGGFLSGSGNAWRLPGGAADGTNAFVTVFGERVGRPSGQDGWRRTRLARETGLLCADLAAAGRGGARADFGGAALFAVQLAQTGRAADAATVWDAIERSCGAEKALADAAAALARRDIERLHDRTAREGVDFAALERGLAGSLARNPPGGDARDPRAEFLAEVRARLAGPPPDVPGLDAEEQALARALADWTGWPDDLRPKPDAVPWLLPAAWTNAVAMPDDAAGRILRRGARALPLLAALRADRYPTPWRGYQRMDRKPFGTRGEAAYVLMEHWMLASLSPRPMGAEALDFATNGLANATADDLLLVCVRRACGASQYTPLTPLAAAALARRLGDEAPLPGFEDALLEAVRNRLEDGARDGLTTGRALVLADLALAIRGEAAAPFRDRLVALLREHGRSFKFDAAAGRGRSDIERDPAAAARRVREWARKTADLFAGRALGNPHPASVRARADAFADWFEKKLWPDQEGKSWPSMLQTTPYTIWWDPPFPLLYKPGAPHNTDPSYWPPFSYN